MEDTEQWAPVSDLMAALLLIFMFIAITAIIGKPEEPPEPVPGTSNTPTPDLCKITYKNLGKEFDVLLQNQIISIRSNENTGHITFSFNNSGLFDLGSAKIRPEFKNTLEFFFIKYIEWLKENYGLDSSDIKEVRIEGHSSLEWAGVNEAEAYELNMKLSQERAYAVLEFIRDTLIDEDYKKIRPLMQTSGRSSSEPLNQYGKPVLPDEEPDMEKSRRVEIHLLVKECIR